MTWVVFFVPDLDLVTYVTSQIFITINEIYYLNLENLNFVLKKYMLYNERNKSNGILHKIHFLPLKFVILTTPVILYFITYALENRVV